MNCLIYSDNFRSEDDVYFGWPGQLVVRVAAGDRKQSSPRSLILLGNALAEAISLLIPNKPEACNNPSRWLSEATPPDNTGKDVTPEGYHPLCYPSGVGANKINNRWYRPAWAGAQPPATIVAFLRNAEIITEEIV